MLRIEVEQRGSTAFVAPVGDLDVATSRELGGTLERLRLRASVREVVVDLRRLSFMDSTGLATIIRADTESRRDGFDLTLVKAPSHVHRVFVLTGMDKRLGMVDEPPEPRPPPRGERR